MTGGFVDVADVNADVELRAQLACAAFGIVEKLDEVFVGFALLPFGDVGGDGQASSGDLVAKTPVFKVAQTAVEVSGQASRLFPDTQVLERLSSIPTLDANRFPATLKLMIQQRHLPAPPQT